MTGPRETGRKLRTKERKVYTDDGLDDDDIEGKRSFSVEEKLKSNKYNSKFVRHLNGEDVNLKLFQRDGFDTPMLVLAKAGLGLRVPSQSFTVSDVKQCVGSRRQLDVMDVTTQRALEMTMKEWVKYYENTDRDRLLNVISLEFSHTKLENYVEQPHVVRQLDWVDTVWPQYLKECQTESTNIIERMKYPKVQKYCLMSVNGCYTDFHIDFGGTSVWYHILHGKKIFWLIPPTDKNLELYEAWVLSGKQGDVFFGDQVEHCQKVKLEEGNTFFIPTGWIHAVYTPKDSLVFGGNFIHSFSIPMQLKIAEIEDKTHVPAKFRYPFYGEMLWYVCERYVSCLTGRNYRQKSEEELKEEEELKKAKEAAKRSANAEIKIKVEVEVKAEPKSTESVEVKTEDQGSISETFVKMEKSETELTEEDAASKRRSMVRMDFSPPRSPVLEEHSYVASPCPVSPVSMTAKSPRPSDSETDDKSSKPRLVRPTDCSDKKDSKVNRVDAESTKCSPSTSQSDLIRPVSVKLEKCLVNGDDRPKKVPRRFLTKYECQGLSDLADWLEQLPSSKKSIPKDIPDPYGLIREVRKVVEDHVNDDQERAITGEPILRWKQRKTKTKTTSMYKKTPGAKGPKPASNSIRRRRTRCKQCEPCTRPECGECRFCKDMKKFGGPGRMKQCCISKQCMAPVLPTSATCMICKQDGLVPGDTEEAEVQCSLMECGICWEIVHPRCLMDKNPSLATEGSINEDLPNSWECPKCCGDGKQGQLKPRAIKGISAKKIEGRQSSAGSETFDWRDDGGGDAREEGGSHDMKKVKVDQDQKRSLRHRGSGDPKVQDGTPGGKDENEGVTTRSSRSKVKKEITEDEGLPKKRLKHESRSKSPLQPKDNQEKRNSPKTTPPKSLRSTSKSPHRHQAGSRSPGITRSPGFSRSPVLSPGRRLTSRGRERIRGARTNKGCARITCSTSQADSYELHEEYASVAPPVCEQESSVDVFPEGVCDGEEHVPEQSQTEYAAEFPRYRLVRPHDVTIKSQIHPVRPAPGPPPSSFVELEDGSHHPLTVDLWTRIFGYLSQAEISRCVRVCKTWHRWGLNHNLWEHIDLSYRKILKCHLIGVVRRQPDGLTLNSTVLSQKQLGWLVARLPHLKHLKLKGLSWATVSAIATIHCPMLHSLDVSFVEKLGDDELKILVGPPPDHHPGVDNSKSRLSRLRRLDLSGTDISMESFKLLQRHLLDLEYINLRYCTNIPQTHWPADGKPPYSRKSAGHK